MSRTVSLCKFRGCGEVCVEGLKTCPQHTPERAKPGRPPCQCGKHAIYSSGMCGTCYQRERRKKVLKPKELEVLKERDRQVRQAISYAYAVISAHPMTFEEARASYIRSMGWNNLKLLYPHLCAKAMDFGVIPE